MWILTDNQVRRGGVYLSTYTFYLLDKLHLSDLKMHLMTRSFCSFFFYQNGLIPPASFGCGFRQIEAICREMFSISSGLTVPFLSLLLSLNTWKSCTDSNVVFCYKSRSFCSGRLNKKQSISFCFCGFWKPKKSAKMILGAESTNSFLLSFRSFKFLHLHKKVNSMCFTNRTFGKYADKIYTYMKHSLSPLNYKMSY